MNERIDYPTGRKNFSIWHKEGVSVAFSYSTPIAFIKTENFLPAMGEEWVVSKNETSDDAPDMGSQTTAKHLSEFRPAEERIPRWKFEELLQEVAA